MKTHNPIVIYTRKRARDNMAGRIGRPISSGKSAPTDWELNLRGTY